MDDGLHVRPSEYSLNTTQNKIEDTFSMAQRTARNVSDCFFILTFVNVRMIYIFFISMLGFYL